MFAILAWIIIKLQKIDRFFVRSSILVSIEIGKFVELSVIIRTIYALICFSFETGHVQICDEHFCEFNWGKSWSNNEQTISNKVFQLREAKNNTWLNYNKKKTKLQLIYEMKIKRKRISLFLF